MNAPSHDSTALRLTGREVLPLLHRVTTQKLDDLPPGGVRTTLFCDFRGRLQHRATVVHAHDGAVWLLRPDAPGNSLAAAVDRVVFREDVRVEDRSGELSVGLVRDESRADDVPAGDLPPRRVHEGGGIALAVAGRGELMDEVSEPDRIALGHARHGLEITDAFNPYDVNLGAHVHLDKGCFTGQEVLLRMVTRDRVLRRLVRLHGGGEVPELQDVRAGADVAGRLTSAVAAPGGWSALAVVRIEPVARGDALALADGTPVLEVHAFPIAEPLGRG